MSNLCSFIFETMPQGLLLLVIVWVKEDDYDTFIKTIMQIRTFTLNLIITRISNKNFETTKYALEKSILSKRLKI